MICNYILLNIFAVFYLVLFCLKYLTCRCVLWQYSAFFSAFKRCLTNATSSFCYSFSLFHFFTRSIHSVFFCLTLCLAVGTFSLWIAEAFVLMCSHQTQRWDKCGPHPVASLVHYVYLSLSLPLWGRFYRVVVMRLNHASYCSSGEKQAIRMTEVAWCMSLGQYSHFLIYYIIYERKLVLCI